MLWQTKTTVSFPLEGKHVVSEHHVIRKSHDATHKKNALTWCILGYHVIGLKQTRGVNNVTLKAAKRIRGCRGLLGRVIIIFYYSDVTDVYFIINNITQTVSSL